MGGGRQESPSPKSRWTTLRATEWSARWGWSMYSLCMGCGAVMVCITSIPYPFHGQHAAATIWLIIDILLFVINVIMSTIRAFKNPRIFRHSFYDQTEAPWFPCVILALATILIGIIDLGIPYAGEWLVSTTEVLFYVYFGLACGTGNSKGLVLQNTWRLLPRPLHLIGPVECLECFPLMLVGSIGSLLCAHLYPYRPDHAFTVFCFALICQGLGFFVSLLKLSVWMTHHLVLPRAPTETLPAYMIVAGPPGFTALALVNLGKIAPDLFPSVGVFANGSLGLDAATAGGVFAVIGVWFALLLTGMYAWFVLVYIGWGTLRILEMLRHGVVGKYDMSWWAWTFPLAGMISCWGQLAKILPSKGFGILGIIGTLFVLCMWIFNVIGTVTILSHGVLPGVPLEFDPRELDLEMSHMSEPTFLAGGGGLSESDDGRARFRGAREAANGEAIETPRLYIS